MKQRKWSFIYNIKGLVALLHHSFCKYLWHAYCVLNTILGARELAIEKIGNKKTYPRELTFY